MREVWGFLEWPGEGAGRPWCLKGTRRGETGRTTARCALALLAVALLLAACGAPADESVDGSAAGALGSTAGLLEALQATGATVQLTEEIEQPFFDVVGQIIRVDGAEVQVFAYEDEESRQAASALISPDGRTVGVDMVTWIDQPNFWARGRLIVLYVGRDPEIIALLSNVLGESITESNEAAIYAAGVRQLYTVDHTYQELPNFATVYLLRTTDDTVGDPSVVRGEARMIAEPVQQGIVERLQELPAEFVWVNSVDEVPRTEQGAVADQGAVVTLGNVHFQEDGSALVSASLYIAPLAATGKTYVLARQEDGWLVIGDTGVQWIS